MINMNLLPPEVKLKLKKAKQTANVFSICLVVVFLVLILGIILTSLKNNYFLPRLEGTKQQIDKANADLTSFEKLENQALFLNDRAKLTQETTKDRANWAEIIQDLANSVPAEVQFTSLTADLTKTPNFVLQGTTNSERDAIKFKEKLENSIFFQDIAFKSSTVSKSTEPNTPEKLDFTLEFNIEKKSTQDSAAKETK